MCGVVIALGKSQHWPKAENLAKSIQLSGLPRERPKQAGVTSFPLLTLWPFVGLCEDTEIAMARRRGGRENDH